MTEPRKKLSLGNVAERERTPADRQRAWNISPGRAEALKERARELRRHPGEAQLALWDRLKDKKLGFTFTRGVIVGSTVVAFACKPRWLIVEIATGGEAERNVAALSDRKLTEAGLRVMRFSEEDVLGDVEPVIASIRDELQKPFEKPGGQRRSHGRA